MNSITAQRLADPGHDSRHVSGTPGTIAGLLDRFGAGALTVLGVWAHPDDETLLAGGILAEVARRGGTVVVISATAGEHGTDDPIADPPHALARRRIGELDAALQSLGGGRAIHLGYEDGGCDQVDERLAAHLIGRIVDDVDPDLIIGFGPDGVTGHPDHLAVGRWTRRAVAERGDGIPLLTVTADAWHDEGVERLHTIGAFWPGFPTDAPATPGHHARLEPEQLIRKLAAIASHASQMTSVVDALGLDHLLSVAGVEGYLAANPAASRLLSHELVPLTA